MRQRKTPAKRSRAVVPAPLPEPWEKQRDESAKAFEAFVIYRDLGARRSQANVRRVLAEGGVSATPTQTERWSTQHGWVARADAWDREQDRIRREAQQEAISQARETESMLGHLLIRAAIRRLTGDENTSEMEPAVIVPLDLNDVTAGEVTALAREGTKILDKSLGIGVGDLSGVTTVPAASVYDLAQSFLAIAVDALDQGMREAVDANGNLGDVIAGAQNRLIAEAGQLYTRTIRS
jgi:hypothetical protein